METATGPLGGWSVGSGPPLLLLHGGPGLSVSYVDDLADELASEFRVAAFQQRGLVVGHSWGGHLALRLMAAHPVRLLGVLAIDPVGVVGVDGCMAAIGAELMARMPREARERARDLDDRAMAGQGTAEDFLEAMRLMWPAYFADPQHAPAMPEMSVSIAAYSGLIDQLAEGTAEVAAQLGQAAVPLGIIAGAASPIPWGQAARATAELCPDAFLDVVPNAGHFVWLEAPGRVREATLRLSAPT